MAQSKHWRVGNVVRHLYDDTPCAVAQMICGCDPMGRKAIAAIVSDYTEHGEDGWILKLYDALPK